LLNVWIFQQFPLNPEENTDYKAYPTETPRYYYLWLCISAGSEDKRIEEHVEDAGAKKKLDNATPNNDIAESDIISKV